MNGIPLPSSGTVSIGEHLASLNLFLEADGTVEITVAGAPGAVARWKVMEPDNRPDRPIDYVEDLIIQAAERMKARRQR